MEASYCGSILSTIDELSYSARVPAIWGSPPGIQMFVQYLLHRPLFRQIELETCCTSGLWSSTFAILSGPGSHRRLTIYTSALDNSNSNSVKVILRSLISSSFLPADGQISGRCPIYILYHVVCARGDNIKNKR